MNVGSKKLIIALVTLLTLCVGILAKDFVRSTSGSVPVEIGMQPPTPIAGSNVTITVSLNTPTSVDQPVSIGCTDPLAFTNLPPEVTIPAGASSTSFTATAGYGVEDYKVLTATCNSTSVISIFTSRQ